MRTEATVLGALTGIPFTAFYTVENLPMYINGFNKGEYFRLGMPLVASALTTAYMYYLIKPIAENLDHELGVVHDEDLLYSKEGNHLKVSFIIDAEQAEQAKNYVQDVREGCLSNSSEKCTYQLLTRNYVTFSREAIEAADISSPLSFYTLEQIGNTMFDEEGPREALLYVSLLEGLS
jgi:hypothetical protein